jgi:hypothetical protein
MGSGRTHFKKRSYGLARACSRNIHLRSRMFGATNPQTRMVTEDGYEVCKGGGRVHEDGSSVSVHCQPAFMPPLLAFTWPASRSGVSPDL